MLMSLIQKCLPHAVRPPEICKQWRPEDQQVIARVSRSLVPGVRERRRGEEERKRGKELKSSCLYLLKLPLTHTLTQTGYEGSDL